MTPEQIRHLEARYASGDSDALGSLWWHYEEKPYHLKPPYDGWFTRFALRLHGHDRTAEAAELVGDLQLQLSKPAKAATYIPAMFRWRTWATQVELNLYLSNERKKLVADFYEVTQESLELLADVLARKATGETFPMAKIPQVIAALQPLVGHTFVTRVKEVDSGKEKLKATTASLQVCKELRERLVKKRILNEKEFEVVRNEFRRLCAKPGAVHDPETIAAPSNPSRPDIIASQKEQVQRLVHDWLRQETESDPESAAVFYLRHFYDGTDQAMFNEIRNRLCERFPAMTELVFIPSDFSKAEPTRKFQIPWPEISRVVFDSHDHNDAANCYRRRSIPHLMKYLTGKGIDPGMIS